MIWCRQIIFSHSSFIFIFSSTTTMTTMIKVLMNELNRSLFCSCVFFVQTMFSHSLSQWWIDKTRTIAWSKCCSFTFQTKSFCSIACFLSSLFFALWSDKNIGERERKRREWRRKREKVRGKKKEKHPCFSQNHRWQVYKSPCIFHLQRVRTRPTFNHQL